MGFFTELKEDLSQAKSETANDQAKNKSKESDKANDLDLDALLQTLDEKEPAEVESAPAAQSLFAPEIKPVSHVSDETATITTGMSIAGDIISSGSLEVLGSVCGNIAINGKLNVVGTVEGDSKAAEIYAENAKITGEVNSQGSVKIGRNSVIIGTIYATSAVVAGAVKGDIDVKGPVVLDTSAIVMGNIKSKSVQINNGAVIEGVCSQCYADVSPTAFFDELKKTKNK